MIMHNEAFWRKCVCGKRRGRFKLYIGNGVMLCLDCMQYWLSKKLKMLNISGSSEKECN